MASTAAWMSPWAKPRRRSSASGPPRFFDDLVNRGKPGLLGLGVTPVEGGIPLMADGKVIGAIGVSGGTSQQDAQVAQAGVAALEGLSKK